MMIEEIKKFKIICDGDDSHQIIIEAPNYFEVARTAEETASWKRKRVPLGMSFVTNIYCPECINKLAPTE